ncbi:maleylpyruvate isomerase N-terminal domain-containing protein [Streptomyces sp. NPDC059378]|uniref:maleylpyruvate isomerase N-terminal domain-containing protein n=1 Tax=Streptomyces sp. NPDC059378 TaxID=3346815 RepID=UPI003698D8CA
MTETIGMAPDITLADIDLLLDEVRASAARVGAGLGSLTDVQAREPSALPGWSRGHVLTHLARSADVYRWLLTLARTGTEPGPRADAAALNRALREGAERPADELTARDFPVARIRVTDLDRAWTLAPAGATVTGPGHSVLAWFAGRGTGPRLRSDVPLPTPPGWPLPPAPGWA